MRHVYEYIFNYRNTPLEEARKTIHIREPFQNETCMHCHSTQNPTWNAIPDHTSTLERVRNGAVSCASEGCHGPAHPFSKDPPPHDAAKEAAKEAARKAAKEAAKELAP
jgi:cytochrome c-type protein NapC